MGQQCCPDRNELRLETNISTEDILPETGLRHGKICRLSGFLATGDCSTKTYKPAALDINGERNAFFLMDNFE